MNRFEARSVWNGLFWSGEFRCPDHGEFIKVMDKGEVQRFAERGEAEKAALRALISYLNGNMVRFGGKFALKAQADRIFHKSRMIPVEHVGRRS